MPTLLEIMRIEIDQDESISGNADRVALSGGFGHSGWLGEPE